MRYRLIIDFDLDPPEGAAMTCSTAARIFLPSATEEKAVAIAISDGRVIEVLKDREGAGDLRTVAHPSGGLPSMQMVMAAIAQPIKGAP